MIVALHIASCERDVVFPLVHCDVTYSSKSVDGSEVAMDGGGSSNNSTLKEIDSNV